MLGLVAFAISMRTRPTQYEDSIFLVTLFSGIIAIILGVCLGFLFYTSLFAIPTRMFLVGHSINLIVGLWEDHALARKQQATQHQFAEK